MLSARMIVFLSLIISSGFAADLPRSAPEAQGVSSAAVLDFIEVSDTVGNKLKDQKIYSVK